MKSKENKTIDTFNTKWDKFREVVDSKGYMDNQYDWFLNRYGWSEKTFLTDLKNSKLVLDAGGGIGQHLNWFAHKVETTNFVNVDTTSSQPLECLKDRKNISFVKANIKNLPFNDGTFDLIYCDRVLMHIDNYEEAIDELIRVLKPNGMLAFSVYRKKSTIRENNDESIRNVVSQLAPNEAIEVCKDLSLLSKDLQKANVNIKIPESLIKNGIFEESTNLWDFLYWNVFKAYYNPQLGTEGSTMINFEYYHPEISYTFDVHTVEKICNTRNLEIINLLMERNSISVRTRKRRI
ncbi:class I SAM-dependent methyltransferase [Algibacter sp.]|jgi:ubiquinone/menaquinone biosynthesis C-methylase UbiE|nr:class I SAM-dependent methyltransferase [Algibacter sp.]